MGTWLNCGISAKSKKEGQAQEVDRRASNTSSRIMENILHWNINGRVLHYGELDTRPCVRASKRHTSNQQSISASEGTRPSALMLSPVLELQEVSPSFLAIPITLGRCPFCYASASSNHKRISTAEILTVCCVCLPDARWQLANLQQLIEQLPTSILLLGDFNAHSPTWGLATTNRAGSRLE